MLLFGSEIGQIVSFGGLLKLRVIFWVEKNKHYFLGLKRHLHYFLGCWKDKLQN